MRVDPTMIQQAVMNLCINARDAMPDGGKLLVKTEAVVLDADDCRGQTGGPPNPARTAAPGTLRAPDGHRYGRRHAARSARPASSSRSSPPRRLARGPVWGWRWSMESCSSTAG